MIATQRQQQIKKLLQKQGQVEISSASRKLDVSEMTVRRDLKVLEEQGVLVRVHGGAVPAGPGKFRRRLKSNQRGKRSAVKKLARFLPKCQIVYFDGSTTIFELADFISGQAGLKVVTNNLETLRRLASIDGVSPLLIGGSLDPRTDNLVGPVAIRSLFGFAFDAAFFSCYAIHARLGQMEITLEDAEVKETVVSRSKNVYVAVDSGKFGRQAAGAWNAPRECSALATEFDPSDQRLGPFKKRFKKIV